MAWKHRLCPAGHLLIDDTIAANVAFGIQSDQVDQDSLRQAAEAAQILDFIEGLPNSWETGVGERGFNSLVVNDNESALLGLYPNPAC